MLCYAILRCVYGALPSTIKNRDRDPGCDDHDHQQDHWSMIWAPRKIIMTGMETSIWVSWYDTDTRNSSQDYYYMY